MRQGAALRCEGLDTIADIELNGQAVGHAENMHRTWEFRCQSPCCGRGERA